MHTHTAVDAPRNRKLSLKAWVFAIGVIGLAVVLAAMDVLGTRNQAEGAAPRNTGEAPAAKRNDAPAQASARDASAATNAEKPSEAELELIGVKADHAESSTKPNDSATISNESQLPASPDASTQHKPTQRQLPAFDAAPISQLLLWYQKEMGTGFLLNEGSALNDDLTPVRVSFMPPQGTSDAELLILLFESMRSVGRVLMPVEGLDNDTLTFNLLRVEEAAGYGVVADQISELEGYYFGSLAINSKLMSVEEMQALLTPLLSRHGRMTALPNTSKLVVSDYIDNLKAMATAASAANSPALRADDLIHRIYTPLRHEVAALGRAVLDARQIGEVYDVTMLESAKTLMVTGERAHVEEALSRLAALDSRMQLEVPPLKMNEYLVKVRTLDEIDDALRNFFERDFNRGQMRMTSFRPREILLIECNAAKFQEVLAFLAEVDRTPRSQDEAKREAKYDALKKASTTSE